LSLPQAGGRKSNPPRQHKVDGGFSMTGDMTRILARLIENTGPISLAHYMGEANTHYYASRDPLGADGDFTTAPEISQMFGEMIGIWLADMILRNGKNSNTSDTRPAFVELGPGRGTLARDAMRTMLQFDVAPEVHFIEGSPVLRERQAAVRPDATRQTAADCCKRVF